MTRTVSSIRNIKYSMIGQVLSLLLNFISRSIFVKYLSAEYLGLNGLFTNVLSILSLAELGIGSAIVFSLYEPLSQNDHKRLNAIMNIYKKAYFAIGLWMLVLGSIITPFLSFFIKDIPDIPNISLIYLMFVLNSSLTYFFSYKRSLIIADQKKYIDSLYHLGQQIILNIVQIIVLIITQNYILFLSVKIVVTFSENYLITRKADRMYPFLRETSKEKLGSKDKQTIIQNIKAMFFHKIGTVIVTGTDNLLLSKFVGIVSVGIYSNYVLIINALESFYSIIFYAVTASVGNLGVSEDKDRLEKIFQNIDFFGFWLYSFSSIALYILINPFILIWLGENYTFSNVTVLVIVTNFYIQGQRKSVLTFKTALGLFWQDRYKPIAESLLNLIISMYLGTKFGVLGILLGTMISTIITSSWIEPYVVYKYAFTKSSISYYSKYIIRIIMTCIVGIITEYFSNLIVGTNLLDFIVKMLIVGIIPNLLMFLIFYKSSEYKFLETIIRDSLLKVRPNKFR